MSDQDIEEEIDQIIDWFDFDRVHKVMTFLDWKWKDDGVPEIPVLRKRARDLIRECIYCMQKNKELDREFLLETGGFAVSAHQYDGGKVYINLRFVLSSWDNYD